VASSGGSGRSRSTVLAAHARLPASLVGNIGAIVLEVRLAPETGACADCAIYPAFPLLQQLLKELLVGRSISEFENVADEFLERYDGAIERAVIAAIRSLAARAER